MFDAPELGKAIAAVSRLPERQKNCLKQCLATSPQTLLDMFAASDVKATTAQ
jgi:hypothetical protein